MGFNQTPQANRLHIAFFGRTNSGKSSLINALTGQEVALVSDMRGTTTDPVFKAMEIQPLGACVFIDTAGFGDTTALGALRAEKTRSVLDRADIAVMVFAENGDFSEEKQWIDAIRGRNLPLLAVVNKSDALPEHAALAARIRREFSLEPVVASAARKTGMQEIREALTRLIPEDFEVKSICGHLVKEGDTVLLVMPQDIQAPKGRLILPQVQTIRDLLDNKCLVLCATTGKLGQALGALRQPPALMVTDSQVFAEVYPQKPPQTRLTSFSVLFSRYKGDVDAFAEGAAAIDRLQETDRVLIAEACTHKPLDGDIARVKLPRLLRQKAGGGLAVDVVSGADFPKDLSPYALVIHCGSCMFNRKYLLSRLARAREAGVPMTNYGMAIAKLTGILEKIDY